MWLDKIVHPPDRYRKFPVLQMILGRLKQESLGASRFLERKGANLAPKNQLAFLVPEGIGRRPDESW